MDELTQLRNTLEELDTSYHFNSKELQILEKHFGRKISLAYPGFVHFVDGKGRNTGSETSSCMDSFSKDTKKLLISLCEQRIKSIQNFAATLDNCNTDTEAMEHCVKMMQQYVADWVAEYGEKEMGSKEAERFKKLLLTVNVGIETGKRVSETHYYTTIVVRNDKGGYYGDIRLFKDHSGQWSFIRSVPLGGRCSGTIDSLHIKKMLIDFLHYIQ